jgi:hypothetical protein
MRYVLSMIVGVGFGAVVGVLLIALLGALSGLPQIIRHADWDNNFPPVVFGAAMVLYGFHVGIPVGAPIGAIVGLIVGVAHASRPPAAPTLQVFGSYPSHDDGD